MSTDTQHDHTVEKKSGAGALAAVIVTVLLVVFGFWAVNTFIANDGEEGVNVQIEVPTESAPADGSGS